MKETLSVINKTKSRIPVLPILRIKNDILGPKYSLSIAYVNEKTSRELNKKWRHKDCPTNVLSFSLSKNSGELILAPSVIKKETKKFNKNFRDLLGFLVIHGMLHLKGMSHSSRMERAEQKNDKKYFGGHRRGHPHDESRRGRV
ncbi:rRNA maturation RNase YbeY [Candidatus Nomurabacteria bacterium RIFCSPLOWO2_01_FULL_41_21]|uniref:Endoribonuclease YbeY n=2 Tax=Candidatus Nomuraibacteriota TaxID=1752729 RepID=A0A1F6V1W1_9BACT|nr:MAG: rRNA maturation RNase YbeY [Candidatus Nomurabacteria bacterium RIFCSPHIGHO2_01_FULL_40_20]OGI88650.1 MAG: rRNA maturation RNase YbeY [Candidatus Nomurabacteria bacterium RIFCSPLOWO2_01_FULL_41_21]